MHMCFNDKVKDLNVFINVLKKCFTDGYPKPLMTVMTDIGRSTLSV